MSGIPIEIGIVSGVADRDTGDQRVVETIIAADDDAVEVRIVTQFVTGFRVIRLTGPYPRFSDPG